MSTEILVDIMGTDKDFCHICLRAKPEVKLDPISPKMCRMFFVELVKCDESKLSGGNICVWCSRRVDSALKLVETARKTDGILVDITQIGKAQCQTFKQIVWDQIQAIKRTHVLTSKVSQVVSCNITPDTGTGFSVKLEREDRGSDNEENACLDGGISEIDSDSKDPISLERCDFLAVKLETESEDQFSSQLVTARKTPGLTETRKRSERKSHAVTKKKMKQIESENTLLKEMEPKKEMETSLYIEIGPWEPVDIDGAQNSVSEGVDEKSGSEFGNQVSKNVSHDDETHVGVEDSDANGEAEFTYSTADAAKHIRLQQLTEAERLQELEERRREARYRNATFRCEPCALGFAFRSTYEAHMERHSESFGAHKCSICGVYVKKLGSYRQHCKKHHARHACALCSFTSPARHTVLTHYLSRHTEQRHKCKRCDSKFSKASGLKHHMKTVHDVESPLFPCPRCSQHLDSRVSYNLHMEQHNRESSSGTPCWHRCDTCGRGFRTASGLRQHRTTHLTERAFHCQRCGDTFKSHWTLQMHMKRKHSRASFECDYCQKTFRVKSDLKEHISWTHLGRGYSCQFCSKMFRTSFLLGRHVKQRHEGRPEPRDKICEVCGKGFTHNNILNIHRRIHSAERPYRCAVCPAAFKQSSTLKTHHTLVHSQR